MIRSLDDIRIHSAEQEQDFRTLQESTMTNKSMACCEYKVEIILLVLAKQYLLCWRDQKGWAAAEAWARKDRPSVGQTDRQEHTEQVEVHTGTEQAVEEHTDTGRAVEEHTDSGRAVEERTDSEPVVQCMWVPMNKTWHQETSVQEEPQDTEYCCPGRLQATEYLASEGRQATEYLASERP